MISIHVLYPRTDDATFDMDYYGANHMPMFADALGDGCKSWGATAIAEGPWIAMGWCLVDSRESLDNALAERGAEIGADLANYTNVAPELIVGEIAAQS